MKILTDPRSGSYQGLTSSRNRYGQYVRTRATPVNPASAAQTAVRARFSTNASAWRNLTAIQQEGWIALGELMVRNDSLGQSYNLTGFQAYLSVNDNLAAAGDALVSAAPAYDPPANSLAITPTLTTAAFSIAWLATPLPAGQRVFISASPQRSPGRNFEGDYRLIQVSAAAAASPLAIFSNYQARFGTPVLGRKVFISVQTYKAGFLGPAIATSAIVA